MPQVNPTLIQKYLKDISYPVNKQELIESVKNMGADESFFDSLHQLPDRRFNTPADVSQAIGILSGMSRDIPRSTALKVFLMQALQDSLAEIELCELALQKTDHDEVKAFAQKMIDDHSRMGSEVEKLALSKNATLPKNAGPENQSRLDRLSALSGKEFDIEFMSQNLEDHEKDIKLFSDYAEQGDDAEIKEMARKAVDVLSHHLQMARYIADRLKS